MEETLWIVVRHWQGGRIEPIGAYRDEEGARYAAGQALIVNPTYHVVLWTVPLKDASNG